MEELDDILDESSSNEPKQVPEGVKILSIFSIIGNSLWIFIILIAMLYVMFVGSLVDSLLPGSTDGIMAVLALLMLLIAGLHIAGLIAAINMRRGKKGAFILYAIVTGIWVALLVLGALSPTNNQNVNFNWFSAAVSLGFIVGFGLQMKNMPDSSK